MRRTLFFLIWLLPVIGFSVAVDAAGASPATVRDGHTIQIGDITYRLDGIEVPELDQPCIDDHADPWTCGIDAREQLRSLIGSREVRCEDRGPDPTFKKRHRGVCSVEGETASLNQALVREGFALNQDASSKGQFKRDELGAKDERKGLWKGCFVAPQEFRIGKKDGSLLGAACRADRDQEIRSVLFPEHPAAPPGCSVKGKRALRARITGNLGIYHLQGCPSYSGLTEPDRWFCSEDDAQAAGFRRAYNCRGNRAK